MTWFRNSFLEVAIKTLLKPWMWSLDICFSTQQRIRTQKLSRKSSLKPWPNTPTYLWQSLPAGDQLLCLNWHKKLLKFSESRRSMPQQKTHRRLKCWDEHTAHSENTKGWTRWRQIIMAQECQNLSFKLQRALPCKHWVWKNQGFPLTQRSWTGQNDFPRRSPGCHASLHQIQSY